MEFSIRIAGTELSSTQREYKGKSFISFPADYCMVDIETTGYSPVWDKIIEIGAIRYVDGQPTERFQTLVQPPMSYYEDDDGNEIGEYVDDFIVELTGITNEMLASAPSTKDAVSAFADFLGDSVIVGYNVNFDINFLYDRYMDYLGMPLKNDFIDVMRIAKKLHPEMNHHRLRDMVEHYGLIHEQEHRSISDCEATQQCYEKLREEAVQKYGDEDSFIQEAFRKKKYWSGARVSDIHGDEAKNNPDCPLYQKYCCITGKLEQFTRQEALQVIADLGGIIEANVTKKTNYLILGNNDYCATIKEGKSSKQKKAEANKLKGQDIEIIPESVFYDMIFDGLSEE